MLFRSLGSGTACRGQKHIVAAMHSWPGYNFIRVKIRHSIERINIMHGTRPQKLSASAMRLLADEAHEDDALAEALLKDPRQFNVSSEEAAYLAEVLGRTADIFRHAAKSQTDEPPSS